jgi:hypothetical protein
MMETAHSTVLYASSSIHADDLHAIVPGSEDTAEYKEIHGVLSRVINETHALYLFTIYTDGSKLYNGVVVGYEEKVGTPV